MPQPANARKGGFRDGQGTGKSFCSAAYFEEDLMRTIRTLAFGALLLASGPALAQAPAAPATPPPPPFTLTSTSFQDGGVIPDKYTQAVAAPISPALSWINTPA